MKNLHSSPQQPVIIIGAGPAGLTAAYELEKLGCKSIILEASDDAGGISKTVNYNGFRFDIGGHRFFSKVPYVNELWYEILADDFIERPRLSRIFYRGHYFDYPLKARNALSGLGPFEAFRVIFSYLKSQVFPLQDEKNFEDWVSNRFGYRLYNIFFKTYTEKVWGIPCHKISADWATQRIKNLSLKQALRNALFSNGKTADGEIITTLIEKFHYPRQGPGMMWETCETRLTESGNPTLHGEYVYKIYYEQQRVTSILSRNADGETKQFDGDHFISSMPLRELIMSLDPLPPDDVVQAANRLRYRDYLTVVLIINRKNVFPDNWIYIHSPEVKLGRIQNYKNWSADMVPDQSKTALGLEYFLWEKDRQWQWPDEQLIELGVRECAALGLIHPDEVEDATVVRMKKAYPVYDHFYHESVEKLRDYLTGFENLQTVGRNGLHRYNNQDHSMMTGVYAARNILGGNYDVWSVNTEKDYHESGQWNATKSEERLIPQPIAAFDDTAGEGNLPNIKNAYAEEIIEDFFSRLDPVAFGLAVGMVTGVIFFLLTAIILLKGESAIAPKLSLLSHYFWGYETNWTGAILGMIEGGFGGFLFGSFAAKLRNLVTSLYTSLIRHQKEVETNRDILDKV